MVVIYYTISILLPIILTIILKHRKAQSMLPPGPKQWPIIGNFYLLGEKPLHSLANLTKTYGPIMSLKLGSTPTIVISSSQVAKEMFLNHDLPLSGRHAITAGQVSDHDKHSMMWLPVGPEWRTLRKISTLHFFTNKNMNKSEGIRYMKVEALVDHAHRCCEHGRALDVKDVMFVTLINIMSTILFSIDLAWYDDDDLKICGLKEYLMENCELAGEPNLSDVFPVIKRLDLQGLGKKCGDSFDKVVGIFEEIIEQRLKDNNNVDGGCFKGDVLDSLLKLVKDGELNLDTIKHLLFDLISAAVDTSSSIVKWAMTELIRHPEKMVKAQKEIDRVIGGKNGLIQESDATKLSYMHAILQETLRLHPPAPLLLPRKATKDVQLCGYLVPKDAQIWVNVWLIGRDPSVWSDPDTFIPERFLETDIDAKLGRDFNWLPFGEGRRKCPGVPLAYKIMPLIMANLLYSFNWKIGDGVNVDDISVEGVTFQRAQPLQVVPLPR